MLNHERLKAVRHAIGFSVHQMALAFGMQGSNADDKIREYERNKRDMSSGQLIILGHLEKALMLGETNATAAEAVPRLITFKDKQNNNAVMHTRYPRFYMLSTTEGNVIAPIDEADSITESLINEAAKQLEG